MHTPLRLEPRFFPDAAPVVRYEVDASDTLIGVNDAWQSFAIANGAPHLMRERILGRPLWDFVSDDTTRLVYDVILRHVRCGARSRFEYRCDSPDRRRLMQMTIAPGHAGHVVFESATICVEWHREPGIVAAALARCCGWCKRAHTEGHGWVELGSDHVDDSRPGTARTPMITGGMCSDCHSRVMSSIDDSGVAALRLHERPARLPTATPTEARPEARRASARERRAPIASLHAS